MSTTMAKHDPQDAAHGEHHPHVSSIFSLILVYVVLVVLTVLTVAAIMVDLGPLNVWIAIFIAALKASVVALFYMHLKYENPFFGQILIGSLFFVALFIGITLMDTSHYRANMTPPATLNTQSP